MRAKTGAIGIGDKVFVSEGCEHYLCHGTVVARSKEDKDLLQVSTASGNLWFGRHYLALRNADGFGTNGPRVCSIIDEAGNTCLAFDHSPRTR